MREAILCEMREAILCEMREAILCEMREAILCEMREAIAFPRITVKNCPNQPGRLTTPLTRRQKLLDSTNHINTVGVQRDG